LRFSLVSPDLADYIEDPELPKWVRRLNRKLTFFHSSRQGLQRNLVISLGQTIYTPEDIDRVEVDENGPAAEKGIRPGDVIVEVSQEEVVTPSKVAEKIKDAIKADRKSVLLLLEGQGGLRFVALRIAKG